MDILLYALLFIIGTLLGSFFTLAIHRIPLKQNITYKRSYCPNCNHELSFLDLIPVFSYIFLGGKCKYCKKRISPRYLIIELISGIFALLFIKSLNLDVYNLRLEQIMYLVFGILFISTLFLIGGIDKNTRKISNSVLAFCFVFETAYIIYLYTLKINIYKYVIYLFVILLLLIIDTILIKKKGNNNYTIQVLILCSYLAIFLQEIETITSIILTLLIIATSQIAKKQNSKTSEETRIPIGFYLCISSMCVFILQSFITFK